MAYLTINDYDCEFDAFQDCLRELSRLHESFRENLDFTKNDRKHALFLLTSALIYSSNIALDLYNKKLFIAVYQIARYVLEAHSLAEYFLILESDTDEEIEKWFSGAIIETRYKNQTKNKIEGVIEKKANIPFKTLARDKLLNREIDIQDGFKKLSLYSHPTVHSTREPLSCDFANLILIPTIDNCVDAQRLYFTPEDSVTGLIFSEFRVLFNDLKSKKLDNSQGNS